MLANGSLRATGALDVQSWELDERAHQIVGPQRRGYMNRLTDVGETARLTQIPFLDRRRLSALDARMIRP